MKKNQSKRREKIETKRTRNHKGENITKEKKGTTFELGRIEQSRKHRENLIQKQTKGSMGK